MLSHRAYIEVLLLIVVHVLHYEGVVPVLPFHLRVEHRVFHICRHSVTFHICIVLLVPVARVRDYLLALHAVSFPE